MRRLELSNSAATSCSCNRALFMLQRLRSSLSSDGIGGTFLKLCAACVDRWFDLRYAGSTCADRDLKDLTILSRNRNRGYKYQTVPVLALRRVFRDLEGRMS